MTVPAIPAPAPSGPSELEVLLLAPIAGAFLTAFLFLMASWLLDRFRRRPR